MTREELIKREIANKMYIYSLYKREIYRLEKELERISNEQKELEEKLKEVVQDGQD